MLDGILKIIGYDLNTYRLKNLEMLTSKHPDFINVKVYYKGRLIPDCKAIIFANKGGWRWSKQELLNGLKELESDCLQ